MPTRSPGDGSDDPGSRPLDRGDQRLLDEADRASAARLRPASDSGRRIDSSGGLGAFPGVLCGRTNIT